MPMLMHQINIGKNNDEQLELLRMSNSKKADSIIIKEPCTNLFSIIKCKVSTTVNEQK